MSESRKIAGRAGVVGFFTFLSRLSGLGRDVAIAHAFGTRLAADAFFVAFRIPNLLRRLFAEGALTVSFVPIFTESLRKGNAEAKRVVDVSFSLMAVVLAGISIAGIFLSPWLVRLTAWGFSGDPEKFQLTVTLTRVMFPYILLVALAALCMGILNSAKHFAAPAASSIFMNLGIIAGAIFFIRWVDPPILGLAVGVLLGGLLQLAIHFPFLRRFGFFPRIAWDPAHPAVRKIVRMMVPAAYGAAVYQFNVIIVTLLASFLPSGSISYLWYADRVMEFPLGIFAISLATVVLPTLSDHAADGDFAALKRTFGLGLRMILFITIPAAGGLIALADPIIRLLFQHGMFNETSAAMTTQALVCFAVGLPFISAVRITSNAFYSLQDSRTPVKVANLSVLMNLILCLIFMSPLRHNGLALAISLSSFFNLAMQLVLLRRKIGLLGLKKMVPVVVKTLIGTALMTGLLLLVGFYWPEQVGGGIFVRSLRLGGLILLGSGSFFGSCYLMKMEEVRGVVRLVRKMGPARLTNSVFKDH